MIASLHKMQVGCIRAKVRVLPPTLNTKALPPPFSFGGGRAFSITGSRVRFCAENAGNPGKKVERL